MRIDDLGLGWSALPAPLPMRRATVDADAWLAVARAVAEERGRLVALWGTDASEAPGTAQALRATDATKATSATGATEAPAAPALRVSAAYATADGLLWIDLPLAAPDFAYPDLVPLFPAAGRMQRAAYDLAGIVARDASDRRPWLQHGAWPAEYFPLRAANAAGVPPPSPVTGYPFVQVAGDGVHEIPVGPVHAGIIEPGHFRFSVVGEKVLRLEERLGYTHKGIERRFTTLPPLDAHRLAGRVSGDSTVAGAWAYCMALESAAGCAIPARAAWLRAMMLERERVANHLGDLGALGNDVALAFGLAQFSRLKEDWLRLSTNAFGHRFMMDCVVPGGVAADIDLGVLERIVRQCAAVEADVRALRAIYDEHAGLQDRFMQTGIVTPALAAQLGLTGLAGRASGQAFDLRVDHPWLPYAALACAKAGHTDGDVAARARVRFDETLESLRLIRAICAELPEGATRMTLALPDGRAAGAGWVEGWRGEVFVALELDGAAGASRIVRCHVHDPSWQNWPVLEHAIIGNIVPDFPLINKSFNLSYSGQDL